MQQKIRSRERAQLFNISNNLFELNSLRTHPRAVDQATDHFRIFANLLAWFLLCAPYEDQKGISSIKEKPQIYAMCNMTKSFSRIFELVQSDRTLTVLTPSWSK